MGPQTMLLLRLFLAGAPHYITGQVLVIDGGLELEWKLTIQLQLFPKCLASHSQQSREDEMLIRVLPCPVLAFLILQIAGCSSMSRMDRRLQTLTLAPAEATGHDSGTGQVSFTATGFFNAAPSQVTPLS